MFVSGFFFCSVQREDSQDVCFRNFKASNRQEKPQFLSRNSMFSDVFVLLLSRSLERTLGMSLGLEDLFIEYVVHLRSTDLEKKTGSSNLLFSLPENCLVPLSR